MSCLGRLDLRRRLEAGLITEVLLEDFGIFKTLLSKTEGVPSNNGSA